MLGKRLDALGPRASFRRTLWAGADDRVCQQPRLPGDEPACLQNLYASGVSRPLRPRDLPQWFQRLETVRRRVSKVPRRALLLAQTLRT